MKKRNILALITASMMAMTALAGCGGDSETSSEESKESSTTTATNSGEESEADSDSPWQKFDDVKLSYLHCWNGTPKYPSDQYGNDVATAIRDKIGVTVEYEGINMSEVEKLNLMFASGDIPDIVNAPYWGGDGGETAVIKKAATEGRLAAIEDLLPNYPNISDCYDVGIVSQNYLENDLEPPEFEGHRYLIPQQTPGDENGVTHWAYGIFVRGDVPEALGIDPQSIKTSDDLYNFMVAARDYGFKDVNGNDCIVATTYHEGWDYSGYQANFTEKKYTSYTLQDDGTVVYDVFNDNWMEKNLFMWKLVNEGLFDKECFNCTDAQADEKVGNGTALMASAQYGVIVNSTKITGLYDSNPEMRYIPIGPLNYADGSQLKQLETMGRSGSPVLFFPTDCENLEAALTYIDYVNSEEGTILVKYGFEGDTFEYNEEGQPRWVDSILERKASGDTSYEDELRERGINFIYGCFYTGDTSYTMFGENNPGDADAAVQEIEDYKLLRPIERLEGYPLTGLVNQYENYETVSQFAFQGTTQEDYQQRAFFAATEEEARQILQDYRDYLTSQEGGIFEDYMEFVNEIAKSRDDVLF